MQSVKQKIDVLCPRCKHVAGTVYAWWETEYRSTYDENKKSDVGKVDVDVKVADSLADKRGSFSLVLDHTCAVP